jgi:type IV secretory pathway TraG/TraD family ATPase VirD4
MTTKYWEWMVAGFQGKPGVGQFVLAYSVVLASFVAGLIINRASLRRFLYSPASALILSIIAAILWSTVGKFVVQHIPGLVDRKGHLPPWPGMLYLIVFLILVGMAGAFLPRLGFRDPAHKRGAYVERDPAPRVSERKRRKLAKLGIVTFAGQSLDYLDETKHFKLLGSTGTGKSTAIRELLADALARGDRVVVADPDGGYLRQFYDPQRGDVILNPFDPRSRRWDLFAELKAPYDYDQLARSLIPESNGHDASWQRYAQTFVSAVLRQCKAVKSGTVGELHRIVSSASMEELRILLEGTPAMPLLEPGNERMFGSVRSVASVALAALEHIDSQTTKDFSVREWVRAGQGALFIPYNADQIASLRSLISTWMRIAIYETMNQGEGDARLWFIVDELDALGAIDGLKDALARLRKFGGRVVLGFQSIAQVRGVYGDADAQTIVENCGNTLILRCSASEGGGTAKYASRLIGERESSANIGWSVNRRYSRAAIRASVFQSSTSPSRRYSPAKSSSYPTCPGS